MTVRTDIRFRSADAECSAWLYLPEGSTRSPVVVMAHGLGAIREMRLDAYAERFVAAGLACLVFDYRHFGSSDGEPRQLLSVRRQLEDWRAAVAYARRHPQVDPDRIALFGTSFSGGHVISIAAELPVAAVVAQCPFTDGFASTLAIPPVTSARLTVRALRDLVAARLGRPPVMVPLAGEPGDVALMTAPDAMAGYLGLVPDGTEHRNEVAARAAIDVLRYRPGRRAAQVRCPLHVTVCDHDSVAPAKATDRHLADADHAEVVHRATGHFDIYTGEEFDQVVTTQTAFLRRTLLLAD